MDPLSQSLFGALSAQTTSKKKDIKVATICGIAGGIAPDIDIFIRSNSDPLLSIDWPIQSLSGDIILSEKDQNGSLISNLDFKILSL